MRTLRDLLNTWETWSSRDVCTRLLERASTDERRASYLPVLDHMPEVDPLDALHAVTKSPGQRLAVHAARLNGATWDRIGARYQHDPGEQVRTDFLEALDQQDHVRPGSPDQYRDAL